MIFTSFSRSQVDLLCGIFNVSRISLNPVGGILPNLHEFIIGSSLTMVAAMRDTDVDTVVATMWDTAVVTAKWGTGVDTVVALLWDTDMDTVVAAMWGTDVDTGGCNVGP